MVNNINCSVFGCSNTYSKTIRQSKSVKFYSFPSRPWMVDRKLKWIAFVKRKDANGKPWQPTQYSKICSEHFINGEKSEDPRSPSYRPSIHLKEQPNLQNKNSKRYDRLRGRETKREKSNLNATVDILELALNEESSAQPTAIICTKEKSVQTCGRSEEGVLIDFQCLFNGNSASTFVNHSSVVKKQYTDSKTGPETKTTYFGGYFSLSDEKLTDLTSVSRNVFALLLGLFPNHPNRKTELPLEDKILLTLVKFKTGLPISSIAGFLNVHERTVARTFDSIIIHIFFTTENWIIFPSQNAIRETMPSSFREHYPTCRIIIDCTEMRTETPPTVEQRIHTYSNYKSSFNVKYLIGIAPSGLITFISHGYGGRATDAFITNDCGVLDKLEDGDVILADKGFPNIQIKENTLLVMPPFAKRNQMQFTSDEVEETYKIASVRIHVERAIQRLKIFRIIGSKITIDMLPRLDMIMHVCSILVNLGPPLIKV